MAWACGRRGAGAAIAVAVAAAAAWILAPSPVMETDLSGQVAVVTGGSRGSGYGFMLGLSEAGATVYITGRTKSALERACADAPGPGRCVPKVVDSADDAALEAFFAELAKETGGRLDILVNNAYSAIGYQRREQLMGKPFWEQGMSYYDEVHSVGVRSHFKASILALPMMRQRRRGLIVNTNSPACVVYAVSVAYGMGKCAIDKMTADMAMELAPEGIEVVSWWAGAPMRSEEIRHGAVDGVMPRRGRPPGFHTVPSFKVVSRTALATTLLFEGRALAALARDARGRSAMSGLAVASTSLGRRYGVRDERGLCPPNLLTVKYMATLFIPALLRFATVEAEDSDFEGPLPRASSAQAFFFNALPNIELPVWLLKLIGGPPLTMQWPMS